MLGQLSKRGYMAAMFSLLLAAQAGAAGSGDDANGAISGSLMSFQPPGAAGVLHFYVSRAADSSATPPSHALIAVHGHPRDASKTFNAAVAAAQRAQRLDDTLVAAPIFQVPSALSKKCRSKGVPEAQDGDLVWTCESWLEGGLASNDPHFSSFDALDAVVAELVRQWPGLRTITVAGFSAGAQMVQHAIGFAADRPGMTLRYVVADPGTWLYFDRDRPLPQGGKAGWSSCDRSDMAGCAFDFVAGPTDCIELNQWKYGMDDIPAQLKPGAAQARRRYARADIHYLEGALDSSDGKGTASGVLDKSCAAEAQGPYRLQRGLAYAAYDRAKLAPHLDRHVTIVPGCAHDVACVFPSDAARAALFDSP
jgi:hypothetical protein